MELIYILLFGIVVAAIRGLFGFVPSDEPESEYVPFFDTERYDEEKKQEIRGVRDHGHGFYDPK